VLGIEAFPEEYGGKSRFRSDFGLINSWRKLKEAIPVSSFNSVGSIKSGYVPDGNMCSEEQICLRGFRPNSATATP